MLVGSSPSSASPLKGHCWTREEQRVEQRKWKDRWGDWKQNIHEHWYQWETSRKNLGHKMPASWAPSVFFELWPAQQTERIISSLRSTESSQKPLETPRDSWCKIGYSPPWIPTFSYTISFGTCAEKAYGHKPPKWLLLKLSSIHFLLK